MMYYLVEHINTRNKVVMTEEYPAEANKMEGDNRGHETTYALALVCPCMPYQSAVCFMECQCYTMQQSPKNKVPSSAMPQTT